jgi:F-type H+-transporting ATPase subunit b
MPQLDVASYLPQFIWLAISFAVLYLLMAKLALPRIGDVLAERTKRREDNLARAEELQGEAEAAEAAYETALSEARSAAHAQLAQSAEAAKVSAEAAIEALNQRLGGEIEAAETEIAADRAEALTQASSIAATAARQAAEKLAGLGVDAATAAEATQAAQRARA